MGQRPSRSSTLPPPVGVPGREGTCRLCFEGGGDLIAPCLCRGTSKWIHRDCLNNWRVSALTNCCECGFQYRMRLERNEELSSEGETRRRQLMRRLASQTLAGFVGVQLVILLLGLAIRLVDVHEDLVRMFGFHQVAGHDKPGTVLEALHYRKLTYYVAGMLLLLALVGGFVCIGLCSIACRQRGIVRPSQRAPFGDCDCDALSCCCECICPRHAGPLETCYRVQLCEDCSNVCINCCTKGGACRARFPCRTRGDGGAKPPSIGAAADRAGHGGARYDRARGPRDVRAGGGGAASLVRRVRR
mmetsp:Transcript_29200/g.92036  ORF Transcript_29200/g.92036 Transcript_29200/m.92036 type:complete len:302 (-) Transcript_29200:62-967(-)